MLVACSGSPERTVPVEVPAALPVEVPRYVALSDEVGVLVTLLEQYQQWRGVPYRLGGSSRSGLDCSGFTRLTYHQRFGIELPRDAASQRDAGTQIPVNALRPGDLVFFRTGVSDRHVGMYLEENRFLHVSTRVGVTVSTFDQPYWAKRFSRAVRIR